MAQTGYTPISIYYSATTTNTPTSGNLVAGELAINTADGKLFYKDSSGVVQTIATKASAALGGSTTGSGATVLQTSPTITTPVIDKITTSVANTSLGAGNASTIKNRIINGAMVIDQRNAGASVDTTTTGNPTFTLDRWAYQCSVVSKFTVQQNAGSVTPPAGFINYLGATSSSAYTVGASELFLLNQCVEGLNCTDLGWGTANAKTVTMSFWVRSSLSGTFGGSLSNSAFNRSYPFSYTISAANTWQQISVTIAGDTSGTWLTTNGIGIRVYFGLGVGSTYSGTAGSWAGSGLFSATGATSVVGTSGATFYITGVQLEVGSSATGYEYRQYGQELALCQRYFEKSYDASVVPNTNAGFVGNVLFVGSSNGSSLFGYVTMQVPKRASPTVTIYPPSGGTANTFDNGGTIGGSYIGYSGFGIYTITLLGSRTTAQWISSAEL